MLYLQAVRSEAEQSLCLVNSMRVAANTDKKAYIAFTKPLRDIIKQVDSPKKKKKKKRINIDDNNASDYGLTIERQ